MNRIHVLGDADRTRLIHLYMTRVFNHFNPLPGELVIDIRPFYASNSYLLQHHNIMGLQNGLTQCFAAVKQAHRLNKMKTPAPTIILQTSLPINWSENDHFREMFLQFPLALSLSEYPVTKTNVAYHIYCTSNTPLDKIVT